MGAILIPDVEPQARMGVASSNFFFRADRRVYHWGVDHGRYPASEQELRDSLGQQLSGEPAIFLRRGRPIPYGVRFATQTKGSLDSSVPPDPGIVDYSVAPDGKEYFLRMTTLQKPVGETVVFYHLPGDKNAWVVTGKLPVPTTEAKP